MRERALRRPGRRLAGAGCLVGVAITHATDLAHKLDHAPYMGVLFIGLIASALALAALLAAGRALAFAWPASGVLALAAMLGFVASRTIGLPQMGDHVGHWLEAAGLASLGFEAVVVVLAATIETRRGQAPLTRPAPTIAATMLVFAAGATAQEAVEPGVHAQGGHQHAGHHGPEYPDLSTVSEAQVAEARDMLRRVHDAVATRFADYDQARAAGYERFTGRGWKRPLAFHLRHAGYERDDRVLDPERPESLVYWWPRSGPPQLVAMMFRAPPEATNGTPAVLTWHQHRNARTGRLGRTAMTHIWLTTDLRAAYANCLPREALEEAIPGFEYSPPRSQQAQESLPCKSPPPR